MTVALIDVNGVLAGFSVYLLHFATEDRLVIDDNTN